MGTIDQRRLAELESRIGRPAPPGLLAMLAERDPIREGDVVLFTPDRIWDVRSTYSLDDSDEADQLDGVYERVGHALPPGALPFAVDWGGNFYCLMLYGPSADRVVYWDHERDAGDPQVEPVADSIEEFFARLVPDPGEAAA